MESLLPPGIEAYARDHSLAPSPLANELEAYTNAHCQDPQMLIGPLEAAVLKLLVRIGNVQRVLEIGMFTGYSALSMAEALPAQGRIVTCDIDPETTRIARTFFARSPHGAKIEARLGPALETLAKMQDEQFDLAFIDADKENYIAYYEAILPRLRAGGVIVADNVLWSGRVLAPQKESDRALVAFNRHVRADARVEAAMLTVRDGLFLIRKKSA